MISNIVILQSASPTLASPTPFAVTITFNTNLVGSPASVASVVANWGKTPALGQVATGSVLGTNPDGTLKCQVVITADQSVPVNFFQLVVTSTTPTTDTDGLSLFSTKDFVATMRPLWMKQYQGLAGWDAITRIFGYRMNQAHTAIMQLAYMRAMLRGVGSQLDTLGTMLGQAREGLSDSDFLDVLLTRVVQFNGDARAEDLINIANLLGRPTVMQYLEGFAAFSILLVGPNPINSRNDLLNSLAVSKLAGVQMQTLKASSPVFTFDLVDANHAGFDIGHLADRY